jgi:hypothetical protein
MLCFCLKQKAKIAAKRKNLTWDLMGENIVKLFFSETTEPFEKQT